jgi:hypothetical protein
MGSTGLISGPINQVCNLLENLNSIPLIGVTLANLVVTACTQLANLFSFVGL